MSNPFEALGGLSPEKEASLNNKPSKSKANADGSAPKTPKKRNKHRRGTEQGSNTFSPPATPQKSNPKKTFPQPDKDGWVTPYPAKSPTRSPARAPAAARSPSPATRTPSPAPPVMVRHQRLDRPGDAPTTLTPPQKKSFRRVHANGWETVDREENSLSKSPAGTLTAPKTPSTPSPAPRTSPQGSAAVTSNSLPVAHQSRFPSRPMQKQPTNNGYSKTAARPVPKQPSQIQQAAPAKKNMALGGEDFPPLPSTSKWSSAAAAPPKLTFPYKMEITILSPSKSPKVTRSSQTAPIPRATHRVSWKSGLNELQTKKQC